MITTPLRVRKEQQATSSTHKEVEVDSIPGNVVNIPHKHKNRSFFNRPCGGAKRTLCFDAHLGQLRGLYVLTHT